MHKVQLDSRRSCYAMGAAAVGALHITACPGGSSAYGSDTCGCRPGHHTHMSAVQKLSDPQDCTPEDVAQPTEACQEMSHNRSLSIRIDGRLTGQAHCLMPGRKRSRLQMAVD